jgi:hypothetical protein
MDVRVVLKQGLLCIETYPSMSFYCFYALIPQVNHFDETVCFSMIARSNLARPVFDTRDSFFLEDDD